MKVSDEGAPTVVQTTIAGADMQLLGVAAAPTGQAVVVWLSGGKTGAYLAPVSASGGTLHVGSPSLLREFGAMSSVAFDGQAFLLLGGASMCCQTPTGLTAQRVGLDGVPVGGVLHPVPLNANVQLLSTVSTPKGAAVQWVTESPTSPSMHVSLITDDGALARDVVLTDERRPPGLTWTGDRLLYVAPDASSEVPATTVRDFGWFGESAWEASVPGTADGAAAMASGKVYLSVTDSTEANSTHSVYAVTPGGAAAVAQHLPSASILGSDGCGHVLIASAPPRPSGVPYENGSPWSVRVLGSSAAVNVGSDLPYMYMSTGAFLAGPTSVGFVWSETSMGSASPSTARFATIQWH